MSRELKGKLSSSSRTRWDWGCHHCPFEWKDSLQGEYTFSPCIHSFIACIWPCRRSISKNLWVREWKCGQGWNEEGDSAGLPSVYAPTPNCPSNLLREEKKRCFLAVAIMAIHVWLSSHLSSHFSGPGTYCQLWARWGRSVRWMSHGNSWAG